MYVMMDGKLTTAEVTKVRAITNIEGANITQVGGTSLTGRDWSSDFQNLQNLDVALSTRASELTLSNLYNAYNTRSVNRNYAVVRKLIGQDLTSGYSTTFSIGRRYKKIYFKSTAATNFRLYWAPDSTYDYLVEITNQTSITYYESTAADMDSWRSYAYFKIEIDPAGVAGDTFDLIVVAFTG